MAVAVHPALVRREQRVLAVRLLLAGLLVVAGIGYLSGALTREVTVGHLLSQTQAGRVDQVRVVDGTARWRTSGLLGWSAPLSSASDSLTGPDGGALVLRTAADVERALAFYAPDRDVVVVGRHLLDLSWALEGLVLACFLLLVLGPDPWVFTRWGWFWIGTIGASAGGPLLFLLLSGPRPVAARVRWRGRRDGADGFGLALLAMVVAYGVRALLLAWLLPDRPSGYSVRTPAPG